MKQLEPYYPGCGIISRAFFEKINAGHIRPVITQFNQTTGETIMADQPPPAWAVGVRDYLKPTRELIKR